MFNYSWNSTNLINWLLPTFLRKPKMVAWLKSLLSPLDEKHQEFLTYVDSKRYELDFTGQVISLERLLNNKYDAADRRIFISQEKADEIFFFDDDDISAASKVFFFDDGDVSLGSEVAFFFFSDSSGSLSDFIVCLPSSIIFDEAELRSLVNRYKLAGKEFSVQLF